MNTINYGDFPYNSNPACINPPVPNYPTSSTIVQNDMDPFPLLSHDNANTPAYPIPTENARSPWIGFDNPDFHNRKRPSPQPAPPANFNTLYAQDNEEQKRQKRLEKNREIAKNCRKRRKEKKELLEEEVAFASLFYSFE